jgi:hypothetical protein
VQVTGILWPDGGLLRVPQASQAAWTSWLPGVLAVQHGVKAGPMADCVISGLGREPSGARGDQPGGSPRCSAHPRRCWSGGLRAGVADCPALQVPHSRGSAFLAFLRGDGELPGEGRGSPSWPLLPESAGSSDRARAVPRVSARQPVTNQVTALPGFLAARVFMTARGIAGTCAPARPLRDVCLW